MTTGTEKFRFSEGQVIAGRYRVEKVVGKGGMGIVAKVTDLALEDATIALKLLFPHLVEDKTIFARFHNEVLVSRQLSHPNIVRLYDFGQDDKGFAYLSMEYIEGVSLSTLINSETENKLSFTSILKILYDVAQGMAHAHNEGVVHRDIKPDNVIVAANGKIKITDLGMARALEVDKGFTATGEAVGTPYYMAPETIQGCDPDKRSDIYSFGIMAYEMATGKRPFVDQNWLNLARMHLLQPLPEMAGKAKNYPKWFHDFVKKCAEKKMENRFQRFEDILRLLEPYLDNRSAQPKMEASSIALPTENNKRFLHKSLLGFFGIVAGVIIGGLLFLLKIF